MVVQVLEMCKSVFFFFDMSVFYAVIPLCLKEGKLPCEQM